VEYQNFTIKSVGQGNIWQVCWARQYLVWEGLLSSELRGIWKLTDKGISTTLTEGQSREIVKKWVMRHAQLRTQSTKDNPQKADTPSKINLMKT
jgi:restriction system protein